MPPRPRGEKSRRSHPRSLRISVAPRFLYHLSNLCPSLRSLDPVTPCHKLHYPCNQTHPIQIHPLWPSPLQEQQQRISQLHPRKQYQGLKRRHMGHSQPHRVLHASGASCIVDNEVMLWPIRLFMVSDRFILGTGFQGCL